MKKIGLSLIFLLSASLAFSQSKSYLALQERFEEESDVHSFNLSGFLCRMAVDMIADEDDVTIRNVMKDVQHIRFMVIPRRAFLNQGVSVGGLKGLLAKDEFDEMLSVRDHGDHVTVFHRAEGNKKNRYFVLVEESDEVVAIEMKGYVDPQFFIDEDKRLSLVR